MLVLPIMRTNFRNAFDLVEYDKLKLDCEKIDAILNGGFQSNVINEIVGCSGSGKTQICLILSLMVQLPRELGGLEKVAVYICTEEAFPIKRLRQLNCWFQQKYKRKNYLDNVFISHVSEYDKLITVLDKQLPHLMYTKNVGLIIIDSIAGLFRSDNIDVCYINRGKQLTDLVVRLRKLGAKHNCVIICINQVVDNIVTETNEPCLGLSWSNLVNARFYIDRTEYTKPQRVFRTIYSPNSLDYSECNFTITDKGLE